MAWTCRARCRFPRPRTTPLLRRSLASISGSEISGSKNPSLRPWEWRFRRRRKQRSHPRSARSWDLGALGATEPELALADGPWSVSADLEEEGESPLGGLFSSTVAVEPPAAEDSVGILGDAGLAEIFKEFKKGVDKQLGKEDYDTRYNLGIAYKEMGLVDEAIAEFQLAAKDESRLLECSSMLGICFMEKGMPALAVKWFEKGLAARGRQQEEYQGLRYDLAAAHEASGNPGMALGLFREIFRKDASFRDVAERVRQLAASPSV
jgi:tetratricopeptide (TPR) repeat protein